MLALLALVAGLIAAPACAGVTPAGTVIQNTAAIRYQDSSGRAQPAAWSNLVTVVVSEPVAEAGVLVTPSAGWGYGGPGEVVFYAVAVTNTGSAPDSFDLSIRSAADPAWAVAIYKDDGAGGGIPGNGIHEPYEYNSAATTGVLAVNAVFRCFVAVLIPQSAQGEDGDIATLSATSRADPAVRVRAAFTTAVLPAPLKGQVKDRASGECLIGATVNVYRDETWVDSTLAEGRYAMYEFGRELPPGLYRVSASRDGYVRQTKWNIPVTGTDTAYVNFFLEPAVARSARLTGAVTDEVTSAPVIGATVLAFRDGDLVQQATTGSDGVYEISTDLPAGVYAVKVAAYGYAAEEEPAVYLFAGETTVLNLSLTPTGGGVVDPADSARVTGRVIDRATGAPIPGAAVIVRSYASVIGRAVTGPTGTYDISQNLPAGVYVVEVFASGYIPQGVSDVRFVAGRTTMVNFSLIRW